MCGIVGAIAERDVVPLLMEGIKRGGAPERATTLTGLGTIDSLATAQGNLVFDANGEASTDAFVNVQWNADGELVLWDGTAAGLLPNVNQ